MPPVNLTRYNAGNKVEYSNQGFSFPGGPGKVYKATVEKPFTPGEGVTIKFNAAPYPQGSPVMMVRNANALRGARAAPMSGGKRTRKQRGRKTRKMTRRRR